MKKQFSRATLLGNFRILDSLKKGKVTALQLQKYIIFNDFFCKTKSLLTGFSLYAQTSEE